MGSTTAAGIVEIPSVHAFAETVDRVQRMLRAKGLTLFAVVDHSGEAEKFGLSMPPTKLLIFGSPQAGTPLMIAAPTAAIDLPLKILVRQDAGGNVLVGYNSPAWLRDRHDFPRELIANIAGVEALASAAAN